MKLGRLNLGRLAPSGLALVMVLAFLGVQIAVGPPARAATNQFHGVNWANRDDNFITGPNVPVGLSTADDYATTYAKAVKILQGFQGLGANTIRFGINPATTSTSWWSSVTAAYDAAAALGLNVVITPWLQNGTVSDTAEFYAMWDTVMAKYAGNSNFYFDLANEPYRDDATTLTNLAADWLARYPNIPRNRMIIPGVGADQWLCAVGADPRLNGTLLSIHLYSMFGVSHPTEADWVTEFKNNVCGYGDRAFLTEFGVPMNTGVDYNAPATTNNMAYFYALTDTVRSAGIGSLLWTGVKETNQTDGPGPCDNASCAMTSLTGTGTVQVTNRSGLDRLQWGWGTGTNPGSGSGAGGGGGATGSGVIKGQESGRCVDARASITTSGAATELQDCTGSADQTWTATSAKQLQAQGKCLDASGAGTENGTPVIIWDCTGGTNQQWTVNTDGTVVGVGSGKCLDAAAHGTGNGTKLQLWTCSGKANQAWSGLASSGVIKGQESGRCVDARASITTSGAATELQDCTGSADQTWTATSAKQLQAQGKCLDASGAGTENGTPVIIWDCTGGTNQQWTVNTDGTVVGVGSGKCLDAAAHGTGNGTKLQLWTCSGKANQAWSRT